MINFIKIFLVFVFFSLLIQNSIQTENVQSATSEDVSDTFGAAVSGTECSLCEFVANYVEGYLAENKTEIQIEALLDKVCDLGPNSFVQECDSFVNTSIPDIISEFENYETPTEVCTQLGYC